MYTNDGSIDLKNKPALRSKTGRWKACSFLVVYEVLERMLFYGIFSNLVIYLTDKLHESTPTASKNVNNWGGVIWLLPIFGAYVADAGLGRFWTFCVFSLVYITGMVLMTVSVWVPSLKPPPCNGTNVCETANSVELGMFYTALYITAIGIGGTKPNVTAMGADQFDEFHDEKEKSQKSSYYGWWMFSVFVGQFLGQTVMVYIQDNVGFEWGYGIPTIGLVIAIVIFAIGTPFYRHKTPQANPYSQIVKVLFSAVCKRRLRDVSDTTDLHELDSAVYSSLNKRSIPHTDNFRFLDKAAIKAKGGTKASKILCTVTEVEEIKLMLKMVPVWLCILVSAIMLTQVNTLFVKQGTKLDRKLGSGFVIPAGSLPAILTLSMMITSVVYEKFLVKILRRVTGKPRGITVLQKLGIGMILQIVSMAAASIADYKRIDAVKESGLSTNARAIAPLSVMILVPQFVIFGVANGFMEPAMLEYFYVSAPESMKTTSTALMFAVIGVGSFVSSVVLTLVNRVTGKIEGNSGWVGNNLNSSCLYCYYMFLGIVGVGNLLIFYVVAKKCSCFESNGDGHDHSGNETKAQVQDI